MDTIQAPTEHKILFSVILRSLLQRWFLRKPRWLGMSRGFTSLNSENVSWSPGSFTTSYDQIVPFKCSEGILVNDTENGDSAVCLLPSNKQGKEDLCSSQNLKSPRFHLLEYSFTIVKHTHAICSPLENNKSKTLLCFLRVDFDYFL